MKKINYKKILANAGFSFFTTLAGLISADALLNINIPITDFLFVALIPAAIQFGLAFCKEWEKAERDAETCETKKIRKTRIVDTHWLCNKLGYLIFWD